MFTLVVKGIQAITDHGFYVFPKHIAVNKHNTYAYSDRH